MITIFEIVFRETTYQIPYIQPKNAEIVKLTQYLTLQLILLKIDGHFQIKPIITKFEIVFRETT